MDNLDEIKICSKCKIEKPLDEFYDDKRSADGKGSQCKDCKREYQRKRYEDPSVKAMIHDYGQKPEVKKAVRIRKHTEEYKKSQQEYDKKPEVRRLRNERYRASEKRKQYNYERRQTEYNKNYQKTYRQENQKEISSVQRQYRLLHPEWYMLSSARKRAKKYGLPFEILESDIKIPDTCPVLGISILRVDGVRTDNSPSLDKVIPDKGYVIGNIGVISDRANRIKGNGSAEEHRKIAEWIDSVLAGEERFDLNNNPKSLEKEMIRSVKSRSKRKGIVCQIKAINIKIPDVCPVLGIPIAKGNGKVEDGSPTVDKIIPELGYVPGNVAVISYRANVLKNNGTADEHRKIASWVSQMTEEGRVV